MDPYRPPKSEDEPQLEVPVKEASPAYCKFCGSGETVDLTVSFDRPNIIVFLLFGWFYVFLRYALKSKEIKCLNCEKQYKYKTIGSWICLGCFISLILLYVIS